MFFHRKGCCGDNTRFLILILSFLFFSTLLCSAISFLGAYVSIMDKFSSPLFNGTNHDDPNVPWESSDLSISDRRYSYGFVEKSLSFGVMFIGSLFGTFILNPFLEKFGPRMVFCVIGVMSTLINVAVPFLVAHSFPGLLVCRVLSGLTFSNVFPVIGVIVNQWAAVDEKGIFVAVLSSYIETSALVTLPLSGVIARKISWPAIFYLHAGAIAIMTILWTVLFRDKPSDHPSVSAEELEIIKKGKPLIQKAMKVPMRRIFRTASIWATWITVFGNFLATQFTISFLTLYLTYGLRHDTVTSGLITIAPIAVLLVIKFLTGLMSDKVSFLSELNKAKLFNSLAMLGSGVVYIIIASCQRFGKPFDEILISVAVALLGFTSGGYPKAIFLVARQFTPFVMSVLQVFYVASVILGSFLVPAMTIDPSFASWQKVFLVYGCVLVVSNSIFIALAEAEPAEWTKTELPTSLEAPSISEGSTSDQTLE